MVASHTASKRRNQTWTSRSCSGSGFMSLLSPCFLELLHEILMLLALEPLAQYGLHPFHVEVQECRLVNPQAGKDRGLQNPFAVGIDRRTGGEMEPEQPIVLNGQNDVFENACLLI